MGNHPKNKQPFVDFLTRKAQLFQRKMDWQDQDAPIILGDLERKRIPLIKPLPLF